MLGAMLLSAINLAYYQQLMAGMRAAIAGQPRSRSFRAATRGGWDAATFRRVEIVSVEEALDGARRADAQWNSEN